MAHIGCGPWNRTRLLLLNREPHRLDANPQNKVERMPRVELGIPAWKAVTARADTRSHQKGALRIAVRLPDSMRRIIACAGLSLAGDFGWNLGSVCLLAPGEYRRLTKSDRFCAVIGAGGIPEPNDRATRPGREQR